MARRPEPVASGDVVGLQGRCELHRIIHQRDDSAVGVLGFPGLLKSAEQDVRPSRKLLGPVCALLKLLDPLLKGSDLGVFGRWLRRQTVDVRVHFGELIKQQLPIERFLKKLNDTLISHRLKHSQHDVVSLPNATLGTLLPVWLVWSHTDVVALLT